MNPNLEEKLVSPECLRLRRRRSWT